MTALNYYSPYTHEHIRTDSPADWMESTEVVPPAYDAETQSCFWRDDKWEVVDVTPEIAYPAVCSPAQGLVALYSIKGIKESDILKAIDGIKEDQTKYLATIAYNKASEWNRDSDSFQMLAGILKLTDDDLNELFAFAATVNI